MASARCPAYPASGRPKCQPDSPRIDPEVTTDPGQGPTLVVESSRLGDLLRLQPLPPHPYALAVKMA